MWSSTQDIYHVISSVSSLQHYKVHNHHTQSSSKQDLEIGQKFSRVGHATPHAAKSHCHSCSWHRATHVHARLLRGTQAQSRWTDDQNHGVVCKGAHVRCHVDRTWNKPCRRWLARETAEQEQPRHDILFANCLICLTHLVRLPLPRRRMDKHTEKISFIRDPDSLCVPILLVRVPRQSTKYQRI